MTVTVEEFAIMSPGPIAPTIAAAITIAIVKEVCMNLWPEGDF